LKNPTIEKGENMALCPKCGTENPKGSKYCEECGTDLYGEKRKGKEKKLDTKEYVAFIILLILGDFSMSSLHTRFAAISHLLSWLDRIMANPEFHKEEINALKELAVSMADGWQFNAWMLAIVGFLLGIILMRWINKIGKWEGLKHALGCIAFAVIIVLIAKLISHFLF
jgi:ribosomal protein L40E